MDSLQSSAFAIFGKPGGILVRILHDPSCCFYKEREVPRRQDLPPLTFPSSISPDEKQHVGSVS